jgi:Protein of unknown function (DUF4235)
MAYVGDQALMKKLPYRILSLGLSVTSGAIAGAIFKQLWKAAAAEDDAPEATDPDRTWKEVLLAAALQGALFAVVKASVERGAVLGRRKATLSGAND